jgi:DNA-binding winged helix-turn-helix (wHTH) protein
MLYTFGDYTLDTTRRELRHQGRPVPLEPKGYQVLLYLVQHSERLVTKDELLEHGWPEVYVIDTTVSRCLTLVRKAVGDSGTAQRVIKTLHGQGYRFVAPVIQAEMPPATLSAPASPPGRPEAVVVGPEASLLPSAFPPLSEGERKLVTVLSGHMSPALSLLLSTRT